MSTLQKRGGSFGIAFESTPGTAEAAPVYFLTVDEANIPHEPVTMERTNNIGADSIGIIQNGLDVAFDFSGAEIGVEPMGYMLWMILGAEVNTTGSHAISSQFDSQYFTCFKDHGGIFDGTNRVQRAVQSRFQSLRIEQALRQYAKVSGSGLSTGIAPLAGPLVPSLDLSANGAPLSWASLVSAQVGWNDAGPSAMDNIKSFNIAIERQIAYAQYSLATDKPTEIVEGERSIMVDITFDLKGADAHATGAYLANTQGQNVEFSVLWTTGTRTLNVVLKPMRITNSVPGPIGAGSEPQEWTISCKGYKNASGGPYSAITAVDGNSTDYSAR